MVKTLILYESLHHGNTKKLVDAIAAEYPVEICDARTFEGDLSKYDLIGFASGVAFGKFYNEIYAVAIDKMPFEKDVFFLFTAGSEFQDLPDHAFPVLPNAPAENGFQSVPYT